MLVGSWRCYHRRSSRCSSFFLVRVSVIAPIGNSDQSSLSAVISIAQADPHLCVSRKVFIKHQVNWNTVCGAMQDLPWRNIWSADNPVDVLNGHLLLLVGRFVPTKAIRVPNKDKSWFDFQCRHAFGLKQEAHLRWTSDYSRVNWEGLIRCQVRTNESYSEAKRQFSARNRDVLMNAQSLHRWRSTLKSAVFGLSSSLTPLVGLGGGLLCDLVGKADLPSDHFDGKQSSESVDLPLTCHPSPRLISFAFRSSEVTRILLDMDLYGALTHWFCFIFFFMRIADALASELCS